jgi:hypothetical protein
MLNYPTPPTGGGLYIIWLSDTHYYGGRARSFRVRWRRHLRSLRRGTHSNPHMQAVFNRYGRFEPKVLVLSRSLDTQIEIEQEWLDRNHGKTGCLNLSPCAHGGNGPHSEETRRRMTGRSLSEAHRESLSKGQKRRWASRGSSEKKTLEILRELSERRKGVPLPLKTKDAISQAQQGREFSASHRRKLREAWGRRKAMGVETRGNHLREESPANADQIVAFVLGGGSIREANRRFFEDGRDHRHLIRRLVSEASIS